jgi:hypothetical protein
MRYSPLVLYRKFLLNGYRDSKNHFIKIKRGKFTKKAVKNQYVK